MSDFRYTIVSHHGMDCLHVLIDAEPMAGAHIPMSDILASYAEHVRKREMASPPQEVRSESVPFPTGWNTVNGQSFTAPLPDGKQIAIPESWKLPPEMRGKPS